MQETSPLPFLGLHLHPYGLCLLAGFLIAVLLLLSLTRGKPQQRLAAGWTALLSLPLALLFSRVFWSLLEPNFKPLLSLHNVLDLSTGGFALYGALLGACLAALLAARLAKIKPLAALDMLSVALCGFLIPARLGEGLTTLGVSRPLTTDLVINSFLAKRDEYDAYLRTYLLEAALALLLLVILYAAYHQAKKSGTVFLRGGLLFGVSQTLMESLRYDGHLRYSFIGVQQVLSAALFSAVLILLAVRQWRARPGSRALPLITLLALPLVLGAIVGVEFLIDRSQLGKIISYGLYLLVLAIPLALGMTLIRREDRLGQATD